MQAISTFVLTECCCSYASFRPPLAHNVWLTAEDGGIRIVFEDSTMPVEGNYNDDIASCGKTWVRTPDGKTTVATRPRSVEYPCVFGIYKGRMDYFYGQYLDVSNAAEMAKLAHAKDLPAPDGSESKFRPDADGKLSYKPTMPGVYGVWSMRLDDEITGEHKSVAYTGNMHATSLTFDWPLGR